MPQQQAVKCIDRPCLVLAGAGSGKTGVITRKIAWLIYQGYAAHHICAVTFTNKAAREMRQRVAALVDKTTARGLKILTFHSLGQRILLQESHRLGYRRGFSIMDSRDVESCIEGLAHQLIANNEHLFAKKLWSASGGGDMIRVFPCKNADDEANRVIVDILSRRFQENTACKQFAILYRSNFQSRNYEKALRDHSIPYQVTGGNAFFERREIKDIMAYLRLLTNADDDQALLRIINVPRREIGTTTIKALATYAGGRKRSLDIAMRELGLLESLNNRSRIRLQDFNDLIEELRHQARHDDAMGLCRTLIAKLDYATWLNETSTSSKQAEAAMGNVMELISWIGNLQKEGDDKSLNTVVSHLSLMSILETNADQEQQDAVQLMTIHAAKGLEFDHVYLVGFEEDSLPHHQSQDPESIQEERRLAYVGITRAASSLTLSYAKTRQKFGDMLQYEVSRFLYELPEEDLEGAEHTLSKMSDSEKHQHGLDTFANLKALLGTAD